MILCQIRPSKTQNYKIALKVWLWNLGRSENISKNPFESFGRCQNNSKSAFGHLGGSFRRDSVR